MKGDLAILVDVYALCLEYDMERYIETSEWHENLCVVVEKKGDKVSHAYKIMKPDGTIEYANAMGLDMIQGDHAIFLFDPEEYSLSTYEQLYKIAMKERNMNERIRWRKHTEDQNDGNNGQTPLG